jgi:hypothetical protein
VLDEPERVVVGPVQVLQPDKAPGAALGDREQEPAQALTQQHDGVDVPGRAGAVRTARHQPGQRGAVGPQLLGGAAQRRLPLPDDGLRERPEGAPARHGPTGEPPQAQLRRPPVDVVEQPGLPDPGLTDDQQHPAPAGRNPVHRRARDRELGRAADDDGAPDRRHRPIVVSRASPVAWSADG